MVDEGAEGPPFQALRTFTIIWTATLLIRSVAEDKVADSTAGMVTESPSVGESKVESVR